MDYYGNTGAIDSSAISVKVYKTKDDVDTENVVKEYTGSDFAEGSMPVMVAEKHEVVVSLTPDSLNTYIMEDGTPNFDTVVTEKTFTMEGDKSIFVLFSENAITKTEYTFTAGSGGDVEYSITRKEDEAVVETNKILFNSNKKIQISSYFLGNTKYKIELKAIPLVTEGLTYTFSSWTGTGLVDETKITYEILTSSPKSITANFTYIQPSYRTGIAPTKNGDGWYEIKTKEHNLCSKSSERWNW